LSNEKIVESYKRKLASEDGWVLKRGAQLRIALCYPNVYRSAWRTSAFRRCMSSSTTFLKFRANEFSCRTGRGRGRVVGEASEARASKGRANAPRVGSTRILRNSSVRRPPHDRDSNELANTNGPELRFSRSNRKHQSAI
jgi:hypothetical protein